MIRSYFKPFGKYFPPRGESLKSFRETTFAMRGNAKPFGKRLSPCAEIPNHSGNDFRQARKCQTIRETTFAKRGNAKPLGKRLRPSAEMPNLSGNDFRHARKCHFFTPHGLVVDERPDIIFYALVYHSIMQCNSIAITKSS